MISSRFGSPRSSTLSAASASTKSTRALTYPRTNCRFITSDMIHEIKRASIAAAGRRSAGVCDGGQATRPRLDVLPLEGALSTTRKVTDHHAIIPTLAERHPVRQDGLGRPAASTTSVVRRCTAVFHPEAVFENTRVETTVAEKLRLPHARQVAGRARLARRSLRGGRLAPTPAPANQEEEDEGADQQLPKLEKGEQAKVQRVAWSPRRPSHHGATPRLVARRDGDRPASSSTTRNCARR